MSFSMSDSVAPVPSPSVVAAGGLVPSSPVAPRGRIVMMANIRRYSDFNSYVAVEISNQWQLFIMLRH